MKTDHELLELAAKAAGINPRRLPDAWPDRFDDDQWNPLLDDGDALRLAVNLHIRIASIGDRACAFIGLREFWEPENNDPYSATRRAIVLCSAAIGEQIT